MRYLLAVALVVLVGCAGSKESKEPTWVYRDQRSLSTTRPATALGKSADLVVRVERYEGAPAGVVMPKSVPAGAKLVASAESLATYGTQFYCTVALPEHRIELGGMATAGPGQDKQDKYVRLEIGFADNRPGGHSSFSSNFMLGLGETHVMNGCSDGSFTTLTIQPVAR